MPLPRKQVQSWVEICTNSPIFAGPDSPPPDSQWWDGVKTISQSGNKCWLGSWGGTIFGQIEQLLLPHQSSQESLAILGVFELSDILHPHYEMPFFIETPHIPRICCISKSLTPRRVQNINFIFNVQHDCYMSKCAVTGMHYKKHERELTQRKISTLVHTNEHQFVINLHALHNAQCLHVVLPHHLTIPTPIHANSQEFHFATAAQLRISQKEKRKQTAAKSHATCLENQIKQGTQNPLSQPPFRHADHLPSGHSIDPHDLWSDHENSDPEASFADPLDIGATPPIEQPLCAQGIKRRKL
ncbi:hypothetical protein K439DRAFT_1620914 [Ramaria rubella]|nr:hypothetical protein K439DRAFT_1620914 [Ramaria rubella]